MSGSAAGPYAAEIGQIDAATSLDQIAGIAQRFSATATRHDGVLYGGDVGKSAAGRSISGNPVARHLADTHGLSMVDDTERGRFLGNDGDPAAVLGATQDAFRHAARDGLYHQAAADGTFRVALSREAVAPLGLDATRHSPAANLLTEGYLKAEPMGALADLRAASGLPAAGSIAGAGLRTASALGTAYDAVTTARHYSDLVQSHNQVGAEAVAGRWASRTGGGMLGGMLAGAAYGAVAGVETGPGVVATTVIGGVVGAAGGEALARARERHRADNQTGADGTSYSWRNGTWEHRPWVGAATPAPAAERAGLDDKRETRIVDTAMADIHDTHAAAQVARAYVMDYQGRGWSRAGPLPDTVTDALHMPRKQTIHHPASGRDWIFDNGRYSRTGAMAGLFGPSSPAPAERARLENNRLAAVAENRQTGAALIDRAWAQAHPAAAANAAGPDHAAYWQTQAQKAPAPTPAQQLQTEVVYQVRSARLH